MLVSMSQKACCRLLLRTGAMCFNGSARIRKSFAARTCKQSATRLFCKELSTGGKVPTSCVRNPCEHNCYAMLARAQQHVAPAGAASCTGHITKIWR